MQTHRHLAHVLPLARQPLVFLTVVTKNRRPILANAQAFEVLTNIWRLSAEIDDWFVGDYLLMPDHVHLFAKAGMEAKPLAAWMGSWKSLSARRLKNLAGLIPPFWQSDYFDRFLRTGESYRAKWDYVALNPVRKQLCREPEEWPWKGRLFEINV
jgi:putative transposase